ncbi:WxL domain-containing protein [Bacillus sp. 1NLA3E]|uniref:WxL domain-containing protein n=1 Tax=Bacillus sp. 1NLA3E TaxID=666686 RepID=UPI000247F3DA|nr:WxL domain-containing protein [Bacillus sp. 1NLA3E]AGK53869.1 hypothetical protein B1NLA3E_10555 [Bacillus sp. 1NLA3E]
MKRKRFNSRKWSLMVSLVVLLAISIGWAGDVGAAEESKNSQATVTIQAGGTAENGGLYFSKIPNAVDFGTINLNGIGSTQYGNLTQLSVTDARGTGTGWIVQVSANQLTNTNNETFPYGSLKINAPDSFTPGYAPASNSPVASISKDTSIDNVGGVPVPIFRADNNAGLGLWNIDWPSQSIRLDVPGNVKIGTYTSTITWVLVATP